MTPNDFDVCPTLLERLRAVASATVIYRKHMLGEIEPVMACGIDLDKALSDLNEIMEWIIQQIL